jgi:DNA-binding NtrC family response regulator
VSEGRFRRDLLGRIDQFRIELPSLRKRKEDIPGLVGHFLRKHAKGRSVEISRTALELLEAYDYPMNVRQLENAIIGALARSDPGHVVLPRHLPGEMLGAVLSRSTGSPHDISVPPDLHYKEAREFVAKAIDQLYLKQLLVKHGGNHSKAAEDAGIDRKTFSSRVEQLFADGGDNSGG